MKRYIYYILLLIVVGFVSSCRDGYEENSGGGGDGSGGGVTGDEIEVTFTLDLPAQFNGVSTYGMSHEDENNITRVDILVFKQTGGQELFAYQTSATTIQDITTGDPTKKKFTVKLQRSDDLHRFVVLANCGDEVEGLAPIGTSGVKEEVLERLTHSNTGKWNSGDWFPMWGESGLLPITTSTTAINDLKLIRMVARIDMAVGVDDNIFKLSEVHLYQYNTVGHIVPDTANFNKSTAIAKSVTLPANPGTSTTPMEYTASGNSYIREIYTYEVDTTSEHLEKPCIVVGGYYKGSSDLTFYRIDFVDSEDTYLALLRNHLYTIRITGVSGEGYEDKDKAWRSRPVNITADVVEWNLGDIKNFVVGDDYILGVSQLEYTLPKPKDTTSVLITTDYEDGWTVEFISTGNWLRHVSGSSSKIPNAKDELEFSVEPNPGPDSRIGQIKVTAGRLTVVITVTQTFEDALFLEITDGGGNEISSLIFNTYRGKPSIDPQSYQVDWAPSYADCIINVTPIGGYGFECGGGDDPVSPASISGGTKVYTIQPDPIDPALLDENSGGNPFMERDSYYMYMVNDGDRSEMKAIELKLINYALIPYPADEYPLDGGMYSFQIKTNGRWSASTPGGGMISEILTLQGDANTAGQAFTFITKSSASSVTVSPTPITFSSIDGLFPDVTVYISAEIPPTYTTGDEANCYMLYPSGDGVAIPVSQANKDGQRISSSDELVVELLWSESDKGVNPAGVVRSISIDGIGSSATLNVAPGSMEGNAVVAVRRKSDNVIRWSWHIWVVKYNPDDSSIAHNTYTQTGSGSTITWMDRNLGAISATPNDPKTIGVLYQNGRKDPFPGTTTFGGSTMFSIYNATGSSTNISMVGNINDVDVEMSVQNPMNYYLPASDNNGDWHHRINYAHISGLWYQSSGKTAYDPCPAGWTVYQPKEYFWSAISGLELTLNSSLNGGNSSKVGYWPVTNGITVDGVFYTGNDALKGRYWIGEPNESYGYALTVDNNPQMGANNKRAEGLAVRCVRVR